MRPARARSEEMTMQQLMGMMQGLQEAMAASRVEQEHMQAELAASQTINEELHRTNEELHRVNEELRQGGHNNLGHHDISEPEQSISAPFSPPTLETMMKGGVVMMVERPPISGTPMEVGPLGATPTGATPREDSPIEERGGDASPMEDVSEGALFGEANEAATTKEGSGAPPENNVVERQIGRRIFKLGHLLSQDAVAAVIACHLDAFTLSSSDMPGIDPDFLCHHLTMDAKVRLIRQRRRKFNEERRLVVKEETQK